MHAVLFFPYFMTISKKVILSVTQRIINLCMTIINAAHYIANYSSHCVFSCNAKKLFDRTLYHFDSFLSVKSFLTMSIIDRSTFVKSRYDGFHFTLLYIMHNYYYIKRNYKKNS